MKRVPGILLPFIILTIAVPIAVHAQSPSPSSSPATGDWPMLRGDPSRSADGVDGPKGQPVLRWRYQAQGAANSAMAIVGDLAYISTDDGILHALDITDGTERWHFAPQHTPFGGPAVFDGVLYAFDGSGTLFALDPATGAEEWHSTTTISGPGSPAFADGALFVPGDDNALHALALPGDAERWTYAVPDGQALHTPAYADGMVYIAGDGGGYSAVDATSGQLVWHHDTGADHTGTAVVADGIAYVGGSDDKPGDLVALDAKTGAVLWTDHERAFSPAVEDGMAFSGGDAGAVIAHDAKTGKELWRFPVTGAIRPLAVADGVVYAPADQEHRIYAIDARTGKELWRYDLDGGVDCCDAVANGAVFVGTGLGGVYAIGGSENQPAPAGSTLPTTASVVPAATSTPTASPADIVSGIWHTDRLTDAQVTQAYVAAGGTTR